MSEYTKRTCHKCGRRDIQPNMRKLEIEVETGSSKSGVSGATVLGAFLGHKASGRAIGRTIFNSSKRNYKRKKTVWACKRCEPVGESASNIVQGIVALVFLIFLIAIMK